MKWRLRSCRVTKTTIAELLNSAMVFCGSSRVQTPSIGAFPCQSPQKFTNATLALAGETRHTRARS